MTVRLPEIIRRFLVYDTVRYARVKHTGLSLAFYVGCFMIFAYIVFYQILKSGYHLHREPVQGWSHFSLGTPGRGNCDDRDCHTFKSDEHLPYCERFVKHQDGRQNHGPMPKYRRPCFLYDARDADPGYVDDSILFIPTRETTNRQTIGCPEVLSRESGFLVNHSSYFCPKLWQKVNDSEWDGYTINPEKFRVAILHGFLSRVSDAHSASTTLSGIKNGRMRAMFFSRKMQGFIRVCQKVDVNDDKQEVCELKKIPCVHSRCGMTADEKKAIMTSLHRSSVESASSFSEETQGISHREESSDAAQMHKSQSLSRNNNLRLGLQSHLGFLELLPPNFQGNSSSRYAPSGISQSNITSDSSSKKKRRRFINNLVFQRRASGEMKNNVHDRETWRRVVNNLDETLAHRLDLDLGIYQGKYGLVTSVGFLMKLAGVPSLDEELTIIGDNSTYVPRDLGLNLKVTFDYSNVNEKDWNLFPRSYPSYTMTVRRATPSVTIIRKRVPPFYTLNLNPTGGEQDYRFLHRSETYTNGIKITASHIGEMASFELGRVIIVLTGGVGLFSALVWILDTICTHLWPYSKQFERLKYVDSCLHADSSPVTPASDFLESDEDFTLEGIDIKHRHSEAASGVPSVEHGERHFISMMRAMEERLKEMEAKDYAKDKMLKEMAAKIARLEANAEH